MIFILYSCGNMMQIALHVEELWDEGETRPDQNLVS